MPALEFLFCGSLSEDPLAKSEGGGAPRGATVVEPTVSDGRAPCATRSPFGAPPRHLRDAFGISRSGPRYLGGRRNVPNPSPSDIPREGRSALLADPGTARVREGSVPLRPRGPHRPGTGFLRFPAPGGRFGVTVSPVPSSWFVPPWLASRKRPSVDEALMWVYYHRREVKRCAGQ